MDELMDAIEEYVQTAIALRLSEYGEWQRCEEQYGRAKDELKTRIEQYVRREEDGGIPTPLARREG